MSFQIIGALNKQCYDSLMKTILFLLLLPTYSLAKSLVPASFSTHFEENIVSMASGKEKKSFGKIDYKFPGHIRYEVTSPEATTFVTNPQKSWYYRPPFIAGEEGEVRIQKTSNLPLAKFLDSMKDGLEKSKHFTHKYQGQDLILTFNKDSQKEINLKEVILHATKEAKLVEKLKDFEKLTLVYNDARKVNLKFIDFKEDANFSGDHFIFSVPAKTKISNQ